VRFALKPHYDLPLHKQIELLNTFVLSQILYPAPVSDLPYKEIDVFINRQLRKITGVDKMCSISYLRHELGVLDSKYIAHMRALHFLWHLLNETSFKNTLGELTGPGPYMRLINLAHDIGVDPVQAQCLNKGEWKGVVDRAVRNKAVLEKAAKANGKGVPPPNEHFRPRSYIKLGGGAAKYGIQFRWKLFQKSYNEMAGFDIGLNDTNDELLGQNELPCTNCTRVHRHASTDVADLVHCYKICDNTKTRKMRRKVLCAIAQEVHNKKSYHKVPKWTIPFLSSLEWNNQSRDCTRQVLQYVHLLLKEVKCNESVANRVNKLRKVTIDVLQNL
jgi:hypothetical protein